MLLALETATSICSVALWDENRCVVESTIYRPRKHSELLVPIVRDALAAAGAGTADIEAVAVSKGPGSYTGLRIGASTAKGLAWSADAALVGVPSLEALAYSAAEQASPGDVVAAAFPSRREDVYVAAFRGGGVEGRRDGGGEGRRDGGGEGWRGGGVGRGDVELSGVLEDVVLPAEEAAERLAELPFERLWLVGEGASRLEAFLPEESRRLPASTHHPSASLVARIGGRRLHEGLTEDLFSFEPFYLNASSARPARMSAFEKLSF